MSAERDLVVGELSVAQLCAWALEGCTPELAAAAGRHVLTRADERGGLHVAGCARGVVEVESASLCSSILQDRRAGSCCEDEALRSRLWGEASASVRVCRLHRRVAELEVGAAHVEQLAMSWMRTRRAHTSALRPGVEEVRARTQERLALHARAIVCEVGGRALRGLPGAPVRYWDALERAISAEESGVEVERVLTWVSSRFHGPHTIADCLGVEVAQTPVQRLAWVALEVVESWPAPVGLRRAAVSGDERPLSEAEGSVALALVGRHVAGTSRAPTSATLSSAIEAARCALWV